MNEKNTASKRIGQPLVESVPVSPPIAAVPLSSAVGECAVPFSRTAAVLRHRVWLSVCVAVILASCCLRVQGRTRVALAGVPLPEICNMKRATGWDCPGCGLTRSFISMGHGDWEAAWKFHRLGPVWFVVVVSQVPYRLWQLRRLRHGRGEYLTGFEQPFLFGLFGLLLIVWVIRLFAGTL